MTPSVRELEALQHAAEGHTAAETATAMFASVGTVKDYLAAARRKLGARNTTNAVLIAWRRGLLR